MNRKQRRAEKKQRRPVTKGASLDIQMIYADAFRHHQAGRLSEAERLYRQVLAVDPHHADSLHLLGVVAHNMGRHDVAVDMISRAIAVNAKLAPYHSNLGAVLKAQGKLDEACVCYRRAIDIKPDFPWAHNNLGIALQDQGRLDEALACYRKALDLKPDFPEAHNNFGTVLREFGRLKEARDHIEKAIQLSPKIPMFYLSLTQSKQFVADDLHLTAMHELAQDMGRLSAKEQIELHFALGNALADVKQHEQSFHHLMQGNTLKRQQIAYDEAATLGHLKRIQTVFTPQLMRSKQGFGNSSTVPVFIVGMPRSGSTLVAQILASHPSVFAAGELDDFDSSIASLRDCLHVPFPELAETMSGEDFRQLGVSYIDAIRARSPEAARIIDKMPANFRFVGLIHLALPHARIIHTRRDPLDTCLSCFSTPFKGDHPHNYDLGELGRYYRAYQSLMQHWRHVLPKGVMLEVQYEDVVDDLEGQARRLVAHCALDWDDACLSFHETQRPVRTASVTQVRQPIYRSAVGRARVYGELLGPLKDALAGEPASR
jgi:tetratricopeptide (TPR) repeat protein